jgi:Mce-associated membrane protein
VSTGTTMVRERSTKPGDGDPVVAAAEPVDGTDTAETADAGATGRPGDGRPGRARFYRRPWAFIVVCLIAVAGVAGTVGFGLAWSSGNTQQSGANQAKATASTFLIALTNFDAKSIDADFSKITNMATGNFSSQANKFFGSDIRQKLETALATSRGQIRDIYVESYGGGQASVYSVIDQVYANNTNKTPQSDVLRVVVNLTQRPQGWKVSNVTVLEGGSST